MVHRVNHLSLVRDVQILAQYLVHREHVHLVLLEHRSQGVITANHALVIWVLEIVRTHVSPDPLDRLRPRQLSKSINLGSNVLEIDTYLDFVV